MAVIQELNDYINNYIERITRNIFYINIDTLMMGSVILTSIKKRYYVVSPLSLYTGKWCKWCNRSILDRITAERIYFIHTVNNGKDTDSAIIRNHDINLATRNTIEKEILFKNYHHNRYCEVVLSLYLPMEIKGEIISYM